MPKVKEEKIKLLEASEAAYWRFDCGDGAVAVYIPSGENMSHERALWLLEKAKLKLFDVAHKRK